MKAELISVGTELLLGEIVDTNASWIASRLPRIGLDIYHKSVVGDNLKRVVEAIERALSRSDVVIMTGGLGPTEDDLTREAIAEALGEEMFVDPDMERALRAFFAARGVDFAESNVKQAKLIPSASALANPRGTAPGWFVEKNRAEGERYIIAMPGVPAEMYRMWENEVAPRLREMTGEVLITRVLKTAAVSEAKIDEMLSPLLKSTNPSVGIYAKIDGVHARIGAKAATEEEARALIAPVEEKARRILGPAVWGADDETLEAAGGRMLRERGQTVATMESCTGGLLSSAITDVDGSSDYFKGGYVAYTAELKVAWGVDGAIIDEHGVLSSETAGEMARAALAALAADYGVAVTGIVGPDAVEGKPPGTIHIAVHDGARAEAITYTYNQGRVVNKRRAVNASLFLLRRTLLAAGA